MVRKGYIVAVKILASAMFLYGSWLCDIFLPFVLGYSWAIFRGGDYSGLKLLLLLLALTLVALIYLIASVGMLRLKPWSRIIGIYNSGLTLILSVVAWLACIHMTELAARLAPFEIERGNFAFLFVIFLFLMAPALFILLFFTHSKIKDSLKEGVIQESKGITIFTVLFIIFHLMELTGSYESFSSIFRIPEPYRHIYFWFLNIVDIISLFTAIGLFALKDIFRKIAIVLVSFDLIAYIFESPFISAPDLAHIILLILFLSYDVTFIYFFTRTKIKGQFKKEKKVVSDIKFQK